MIWVSRAVSPLLSLSLLDAQHLKHKDVYQNVDGLSVVGVLTPQLVEDPVCRLREDPAVLCFQQIGALREDRELLVLDLRVVRKQHADDLCRVKKQVLPVADLVADGIVRIVRGG